MTLRLQPLRRAERCGTRRLLGKRFLGATFTVCAGLIAWPSAASDREDALQDRIARVENGLLPSSTAGAAPAPPWNIQERMRYYNVPGISIAVIHNYTLEWAKSFGVLEAGGSTPVNTETLFQAASLSKPVTAMPFGAWIQSTVLDKVEMTRSTFAQPLPRELESNAARGHLSSGSMIRGGWMVHPEQAAAGLWTTASDLARFVIEIQKSYLGRSNRVLTTGMTQQMLTPSVPVYGLGVQLASEGAIFYHSGANNGYRNLVVGYPHTGDGAVILTNGDGGDELRQEVARAIATEYGWAHFRVAGFPVGAPSIADGASVLNAASSQPAVAPGAIVSIYGPDLSGVTEVLFQGQKAAVLAVTSGQINAIVPSGVAPGLALVQVRRSGLISRAREVRIAPSAPGLFSVNQRGDGPGIIVHADSFRLISETEPARRGEHLSILCTGLGVGGAAPALTVGGLPAVVTWSGPMPGFPGVDQVNIQVPGDAMRGASVPVQMRAGDAASNSVTIAIE